MSRRPRPYSAVPRGAGRSARLPSGLGGIVASTGNGRDITRPYTFELEEFRDQRLQGAVDWGVYDRILLDDQVKSCLEQRRSAVVSREWSVISGNDKDPRAVAAAQALEANLQRIGWDNVTDKMLYAPFHGVAVAELEWEPHDGLIQWKRIRVRHARRFRRDRDDRLRLITPANMRGEVMPERKFWVVTAGASDDDQPYGRGLAEWLYWPTLFKRNGIRFWNTFLDKFSVPTAKGTYRPGTPAADIDKLLSALSSIANDTGFVVPDGMAVELLQIATNGIDFEKMPKYMDEAIAKVILSQTMTTDNGSSLSQAKVHSGVKQELITADADLLTDSFTQGPARWFTDLNFGPDVAAPIVLRLVEEEEDTKATAETDAVLARQGWRRTEESFKDIYGDGFERAEPTPEGEGEGAGKKVTPEPEPANDTEPAKKPVSFAASDLRTLYVHRRLKNTADIVAWAKRQKFKSTLPPGEMHVTIAYSRTPVNWFEVGGRFGPPDGELIVPAGGPRLVEPLGDQGAIVLHFGSDELQWRHREIREAGASWDFPSYHPHVTITYAGEGVDLAKVKPYDGKLVFGPEVFEQLDEDWEDRLSEVSFAEPLQAHDIVDEALDQIMADEGWQTVPIAADLVAQLAAATNPEEVQEILARAAELDDGDPMIESLARAGFAIRVAAISGQDTTS